MAGKGTGRDKGRNRDAAARRGAAEPVTGQVGGGLAELSPDRERARAWTLLIDGLRSPTSTWTTPGTWTSPTSAASAT